MNKIHLLVPAEVINKLSERFILTHEDGYHGYFATVMDNEMWSVVRSLVTNGYRVDITPGETVKILARKEQ